MYSQSSALTQIPTAESSRRIQFCGYNHSNRFPWKPPSPLNFDQSLTWDYSSSPPYSESRFNYTHERDQTTRRQFPRYTPTYDSQSTTLATLRPQVVLPPDQTSSSTSSKKQETRRPDDKDSSRKAKLYKTELCRSWEEKGSCRYGIKCQFAHSKAELRDLPRHPKYKTEPCKTFIELGSCYYGSRCCFLHFIPKKTELCNTNTGTGTTAFQSSRSNSVNSTVNPVTPSSSPVSQTLKTTCSVIESSPRTVQASSFDNFVSKDLWEAIEYVDDHLGDTPTRHLV